MLRRKHIDPFGNRLLPYKNPASWADDVRMSQSVTRVSAISTHDLVITVMIPLLDVMLN